MGGLTGLFLGWGIGPTLAASVDGTGVDQIKTASKTVHEVTNRGSSDLRESAGKYTRKVDPFAGIRQVSISSTLLAGFVGIVATTVAQRVGHIPPPRGLGL